MKTLSPDPSPTGRGESASGHYRGGRPFVSLLEQARELRRRQTPAEELLWELLRGRRLGGAKFRRQHQFGPYICDFYCHEARLVIELDGAPHADPDRREADSARDRNLRAEGLTVLRFWNAEVLHGIETVLRQIAAYLPGDDVAPPP
jgi:very-short-patch-repair endonuclease